MRTFSICAVLALSICVVARADDWPRYRGPASDGISHETVFAEANAVSLEVDWRIEIGSGYSGVSIADGRVVTMFSDGKSDILAAFEEENGRELWRQPLEPTYKGHDGSHDGPIATPLIHDGRVFALSALGRLAAFDLEQGTPIWSVDLTEAFAAVKPHYGFASSPLVQDGVLVVQVGGEGTAVVGLDPKTGERKWSVGSDTVDYQSPVAAAFGEHALVLTAGLTKLSGVDPADGRMLFTVDHGGDGFRGARSITPVHAGDGLVFLNHKDDGSSVFELDFSGEAIATKPRWEQRALHNSYTIPIYHEGYLYGYGSRMLTCLDATTGIVVWRSRQPGDGFVTLVDDHLVIATKQGGLYVAAATSSRYEELAGIELFDDLIWTAPAFANGHVFVRSLGELARIAVRSGSAAPGTPAATNAPGSGSRFALFLAELDEATDKKTAVDRWIDSIESFPLVEDEGRVHFFYRGPGTDLAIAGDMIGARRERPMTRVAETDLHYYSTSLEPDARVSYLFIRDFEEITDPLNPKKTTTMVVGKEMEPSMDESAATPISWLGMPRWKPAPHLAADAAKPRGRMESHRLESEAMGREHEIGVYLPAGYANDEKRYPVAIVHGGDGALARGKFPETLEHLSGARIDPPILVFVKTTPPFGNAASYATMVADELIPFVDKTYRTRPSRAARAHIGAGFSGYTALYCAFRRPADAAGVGTLSATMLDFMRDQIEPMFSTAAEWPFVLHMRWGKYDLRNPDEAWDMTRLNRELFDELEVYGLRPGGGETHDGPGWASWRHRVDDLLVALFPAD